MNDDIAFEIQFALQRIAQALESLLELAREEMEDE